MQATCLPKIKSLCQKMNLPFPLPLGKDALLSGSFMWHVLSSDEKTKWTPNDVDIFCGMTAVERMREFLVQNGFKFLYMAELNYMTDMSNLVEFWGFPGSAPYEREERSDVVSYFREFCLEKDIPSLPSNVEFGQRRASLPTVQLIYSKTCQSDASQLIVGEFDFPILENYFDGTEVVVKHPDLVSSRQTPLREKEYNELVSPEPEKRNVVSRKRRYKERIRKYASRGIYFDLGVESIAFTIRKIIFKPDR